MARGLDDPSRLILALIGQAFFCAVAVAVICIVLFWERQPIQSIWLRKFRWQSIGWGLLLLGVYYTILFPLGEWVRRSVGLAGFGTGMDEIMRFPMWFRTIAVLGAGIGEEVLFRGFSVTRLAMLTGNIRLSAAIALVAFYALHVPMWGWGFALGGLISGAGAMAFCVWRKDLLAMIVFHTSTDAIGLILAPMLSQWWKTPALF